MAREAQVRGHVGAIDLAALPIGAYQPRELMRFEDTVPDDAVRAHQDLGAARSFGVHWGTFQLGDEEPFQAAYDLTTAVHRHGASGFGLASIGAVLDVVPNGGSGIAGLEAPSAFGASPITLRPQDSKGATNGWVRTLS